MLVRYEWLLPRKCKISVICLHFPYFKKIPYIPYAVLVMLCGQPGWRFYKALPFLTFSRTPAHPCFPLCLPVHPPRVFSYFSWLLHVLPSFLHCAHMLTCRQLFHWMKWPWASKKGTWYGSFVMARLYVLSILQFSSFPFSVLSVTLVFALIGYLRTCTYRLLIWLWGILDTRCLGSLRMRPRRDQQAGRDRSAWVDLLLAVSIGIRANVRIYALLKSVDPYLQIPIWWNDLSAEGCLVPPWHAREVSGELPVWALWELQGCHQYRQSAMGAPSCL